LFLTAMLATDKFYESFDRVGFLKEAVWKPAAGGIAQSAKVRFRAPTENVLAGEMLSTDYSVRYPSAKFPGLKRDEVLTIDGFKYAVREGPRSQLDGSEMEAKLMRQGPA
jgi:hypothetical protein